MASALAIPRQSVPPVDSVEQLLGSSPLSQRPLNVVCIGAHPDDPESGCGGTLARLASQGHRVTIVYLTRGEAGLKNADAQTASGLRTAESVRACELLGAQPVFANQIDGQTSTEKERSQQFTALLSALEPDIVFTHWPLDTHRDHRNAAQLAYEAWEAMGESFSLVYYEVMTGVQTHHFEPNCFVDISITAAQKRSAIYAHVCQNPDRFYPYHETMERERGSEARLARAEAFVVVRERLPKPCVPFEM